MFSCDCCLLLGPRSALASSWAISEYAWLYRAVLNPVPALTTLLRLERSMRSWLIPARYLPKAGQLFFYHALWLPPQFTYWAACLELVHFLVLCGPLYYRHRSYLLQAPCLCPYWPHRKHCFYSRVLS